MEATAPEAGLAEGYEALATGDWESARAAFESALTVQDVPEAPPGHTPALYAGTKVVEFSPTEPLQETIEVVTRNMEAASTA
jgi:hypothetical protein